jgi:hypothetical protein
MLVLWASKPAGENAKSLVFVANTVVGCSWMLGLLLLLTASNAHPALELSFRAAGTAVLLDGCLVLGLFQAFVSFWGVSSPELVSQEA